MTRLIANVVTSEGKQTKRFKLLLNIVRNKIQ